MGTLPSCRFRVSYGKVWKLRMGLGSRLGFRLNVIAVAKARYPQWLRVLGRPEVRIKLRFRFRVQIEVEVEVEVEVEDDVEIKVKFKVN
jgi:hypothetical protein